MTTDQTPYEIFISYARLDDRPAAADEPGWVSALAAHILNDHRRFSTEPLRIFLDTSEIQSMDDWRYRILGALRRSQVLLVCLSPNYFASGYCRWEWDEYVTHQVHRLMGSDSVAGVYFVEVPESDATQNAAWREGVLRATHTDVRPWFPEGASALRKVEVQRRLAVLGDRLWERIDRARRASGVPGNLRRHSPYFVGRGQELGELHERLALGEIGVVTAVRGLGGPGEDRAGRDLLPRLSPLLSPRPVVAGRARGRSWGRRPGASAPPGAGCGRSRPGTPIPAREVQAPQRRQR